MPSLKPQTLSLDTKRKLILGSLFLGIEIIKMLSERDGDQRPEGFN